MSSDEQGRSGRKRWRAPVIGAMAGLVVAGAIVGQSALADSGSNAGTAANAKAASAPAVNKQAERPAQGDAPDQFFNAVAQLVQAGTISAAQGRAVDAQIQTGSMDPQQMVSSGVLTASQMSALNDKLRAVKQSLVARHEVKARASDAAAPAACDKGGSAGGKADAAPAGTPHQFLDAVAQLVQAGTISAAQGRAVDAQIQTGSMDPQQMVSSGVLTASQMSAVNDKLRAVKESLAPQQPASDAAAPAACAQGAGQAPPG
jgi:Asp-tRNA(Asn)/Glu-tRNA(Gln) amidotransferase B subunit